MEGCEERGSYSEMTLGTPLNPHPIKVLPNIHLELQNGEIIALRDLTFEWASGKAEVHTRSGELWPGTKLVYLPNGFRIYFVDGELAGLWIVRQDNNLPVDLGPAIWDAPREKRYLLPLSHDDAVELFGEPDELIDGYYL